MAKMRPFSSRSTARTPPIRRPCAMPCDLLDDRPRRRAALLNVQPNLGGAISTFVSKDQIDTHHREEGQKGLVTAIEITKKAGVAAKIISASAARASCGRLRRQLGAGLVVIGTSGHNWPAGVTLGSVAQDVIATSKCQSRLCE